MTNCTFVVVVVVVVVVVIVDFFPQYVFFQNSQPQEDRFKLELPDVGDPFKLRVGHDNKGLMAAWHVDTIELTNLQTHSHYVFVVQRWLSRSEADKQIVAEVPLTSSKKMDKSGKLVDVAPPASAALHTYKVPLLLWGGGGHS